MKYIEQEHIERQISTLSEEQFRRFIKEFLRIYYNTKEVEIIDGTNDGGNDVAVYVNKERIKKTFQITVQNSIDKKMIEEFQKAKDNVSEFGFAPQLILYYSHTISGSKKNYYEKIAEREYEIALRIYDRKSLASYVDEYHSLDSLLNTLHQVNKEKVPRIDPKNKIIFDMLTSGGVVNNIKSEFIRTVAQYFIFEKGPQPIEKVVSYVNNQLNCKIDPAYFIELVKSQNSGLMIQENGFCQINESQKERIITMKAETSFVQEGIIQNIGTICIKYRLDSPTPENIFQIISAAYNKTSDIEVDNLSSQTTATEEALTKIINNLKRLIDAKRLATESDVIIKEILSVTVGNEYFAKLATTQLFSNLFKQNELEEYISLIPKNVYLDTQILLQLICCLFESSEYSDFQYISAKTLLKHINNSRCKIFLHTSSDYIEEVCVHLWDGYAVSEIERHLDFSEFGKSNNIFYCYYTYLTSSGIKDYDSYNDFINELIGIDMSSIKSRQEFLREAIAIVIELLSLNDIKIIDTKYLEQSELDRLTKDYSLSEKTNKQKPHRAVISDIKMVQFLSDASNHINPDTQLPDEPFFITCDSSLYSYRQTFISQYPKRLRWYIYTPLKFANRLSVMNFKPDPEALSLDLINVAEANFNASSTNNKKPFIDILSMFVGKTNENSWAISRRIRELSKMNQDCSSNVDFSKVKQTELIETVLTSMAHHYSHIDSPFNMSQLIDLIEDDNYALQFDKFLNDSIREVERGGRIEFTSLDKVLKDRLESK